jgi:hypothetical protein
MPLLSLHRHQTRQLGRAFLTIPGGVLIWAWASLYLGIAESVWTLADLTPWLLALLGAIGLALCTLGVRSTFRKRLQTGDCPTCRYACEGQHRCPECGSTLQRT